MDSQNVRSKVLKCPRCESFDTKFCYYNNYNYSQPRHFCKTCRRYWTIGGVLRNVPVGGGARKSKTSSKSKSKSKSPLIVRDSPPSNLNLNSDVVLSPNCFLAGNTGSGARSSTVTTNLSSVEESRSDLRMLLGNCSSERPSSSVPFVWRSADFGVDGTTALRLNQVGDCYSWIENGKGIEVEAGPAEKRARSGEGFGSSSLDLRRSNGESEEGMVEISSGVAVDGGSWFKFCGLTSPFNN